MLTQSPEMIVLWYVAFIFSIIFHEAAHAFIASRLGDNTAAKGGQVSLNPIVHIKREITGTVIVPLISFISSGWMIGWASAPYDLGWAAKNPKRFAAMSVSGPLANLILVLAALFTINIGYRYGVFHPPPTIGFSSVVLSDFKGMGSYLPVFLSIIFSLNIMLFTFNLLPLPILDGSKVPMFFMKQEMAGRYLAMINNSKFLFITLILTYYFFGHVHKPVRLFFINLLYPGITYG